jgi:hypothetical protein
VSSSRNPHARRYTLAQYKRHARSGSTECLFETAVSDLTADELGSLSLYLQRVGRTVPRCSSAKTNTWVLVDAPWKIPAGFDRKLLALELIAVGWSRDHACAAAQISRATLQRELAASARPPGGLPKWQNGGLEAAFPSGSNVSNRAPLYSGTGELV